MKEIILDTETTGLSVQDGHRIVEIGCIELDNLIPTGNKFHCYLNPEKKVSEKAFEVHGYSDEFLSKQKKFNEIVDEFLNFIKEKKVVIHNAEFDLGHINNELKIIGKKKIDNENIMICHNDGEFPHPCVKRPSDVGEDGEENSNQWGTFRVDTESNNGRDRSYAKLRKDEKKKEGHFKAFKDGKQISDRIFFSQQHFNLWAKENGYQEKFQHINKILNPDKINMTEYGLTFERHIYPSETSIEV